MQAVLDEHLLVGIISIVDVCILYAQCVLSITYILLACRPHFVACMLVQLALTKRLQAYVHK